ncbi:MAG: hypothetical protein P1U38_13305 [Aeromicrobium sp.]|uniref:hypothetical protein n=1 Tax=Aeromicrobium sp. TaxID=1871063 RepID=UPI0025C62DE6|nr:hypothetical protein [Aeromicrobium sp.]MCK5892237.1 hypothetical protein [Aeromicrobium sp.]MDF1705742.1 hypothetical protein [Aeromicrobium sp.]
MRRPALLPLLIALVLGVSACGGSSGGGPDPSATPSGEATSSAAPEALSNFSCVPGEDGLWSATGTISNSGDEAESFTVDVYIGPADGQERPVNRTELANVQPGGSTPLSVSGLAAQGEPATCHVRVLRAQP